MTFTLVRRSSRAIATLGASILAVAALAGSASADITSTADCDAQQHVLSQPFLPIKDANYYFQAPGGDFASPEDVAAAGWQLSDGASLVSTTDYDGRTGYVLDMPSKSKAVTPVMCVTKDYPIARMYVRNVVGGEGVKFYVSYVGTSTWTTPKNTGQVHGGTMQWQAASPINLQPYGVAGWQLVKFTFIAGGNTSRFQISDVWVDPRMR